jgi:hypothetical protein
MAPVETHNCILREILTQGSRAFVVPFCQSFRARNGLNKGEHNMIFYKARIVLDATYRRYTIRDQQAHAVPYYRCDLLQYLLYILKTNNLYQSAQLRNLQFIIERYQMIIPELLESMTKTNCSRMQLYSGSRSPFGVRK